MPLFTQMERAVGAVWGDCLYNGWRGIRRKLAIFLSQMLQDHLPRSRRSHVLRHGWRSTVTWWEAGRMVTTPGSST
jgi:hypothetical protein